MMLSRLVVLLLSLSLGPSGRVFGQRIEENEECGGAGSSIVWEDVAALAHYYARCTYPTNKMKVDCILSSCPLLRGVCPLTSKGNVNNTASRSVVSILNTCIGQNALVCGINMTRTPLVLVAWSLAQLVPPEVANGTVSVVPGTGFIDNFSQSKFSLSPQRAHSKGSITLLIQAPNVVHSGQCSCNFSIASGSVANVFQKLLALPQGYFTIPNMAAMIRVNLSSATVSIDLSTGPSPTIKTLEYQADLNCKYSNFISGSGAEVPSIVVKPFNDKMNSFLKDSVIYATTTNFLSTYTALGLRAAQLNCPTHQ